MTTPAGETPATPAMTPRLSILHIMLWTLCSAVYLTLIRAMNAQQQLPASYAVIRQSTSVLQGIVMGAVFAAAMVLAHARLRYGSPLTRHPGHWLVLIISVTTFTYLVVITAFSALALPFARGVFTATYSAMATAQVIGYLIASWSSKRSSWRPLFATLALLEALRALVYLGMLFDQSNIRIWASTSALPNWGRVIVCGWMMVLSLRDLRRGQRRDWLHWTGIAAFIASTGIVLFWMIGSPFFRS